MQKIIKCFYKDNYVLLLFLLGSVANVYSQCVPNFGAASKFALFTINGAVGNTGASNIVGAIGTNIGAISGFESPSVVNGIIYLANTETTQASADLLLAYTTLYATTATNSTHAPAFGGSETLLAGVYAIGAAGSVGGTLTLDGGGNSDAIFIFKFGGAFTVGAGSTIVLTNGAQAKNVFWVADGAISMAAATTINGTLIANGAISMGVSGVVYGRMFSIGGAVAVYANTIDSTGNELETAIGGEATTNQTIISGTQPLDLALVNNTGHVIRWEKSLDITFTTPTVIACTSKILPGALIGNITQTSFFRAVVQTNTCHSLLAVSTPVIITVETETTVWDGSSWSNGLPSISMNVVISNNYTFSGDTYMDSLTVNNNAIVVIPTGATVIVNGALVVESSSSFTLENDANFIQTSDVQNTGIIKVKRSAVPLMRLDYILWSSPVSNQILQSFSNQTSLNRFYTYDPITNAYNVVVNPYTTTFDKGIGYLIRMPNNHPTTPTVFNSAFSGTPNNGRVILPVVSGTYNAIGNPYPSAIDANEFIADNNIKEALYFWRKTNNSSHTSYACYTTAGGISNSGGDPLVLTPNGDISVGQGFIVKATSSSISFTNSMRLITNDAPFLRTTASKSRIWLDLTSTDGFLSQTMVAYMPGATAGVDEAIDGRYFNDSATALTSIINTEEFTIQGRALPFDANDVVTLGFKTQLAGTYTIGINHFDGLFNADQTIYLKDNLTNTVHDLKSGSYTFTSDAGVFNNRFEIIYQKPLAIEQPVFEKNTVVVYKQNQNIVISTGNTIMMKVDVFDVIGRLLLTQNNINCSQTKLNIDAINDMAIIKITDQNQQVVTKKIAN